MHAALILGLLLAGTQHDGPSGAGVRRVSRPEWVAAKRAAKGGPKGAGRAPGKAAATGGAQPQIVSDAPKVEVRVKKTRSPALAVSSGKTVEATLTGPGSLVLSVYQPLEGKAIEAAQQVQVDAFIDGAAAASVAAKNAKLQGGVLRAKKPGGVTKPESATLAIAAGRHTLIVSVRPTSSVAVLSFEYRLEGAKAPLPIAYVKGVPGAAPSTVAAASPPPEPPPAPVLASAAAPSEALAPSPAPPPAAPAPATSSPPASAATSSQSEVERRVTAGEIRDGLLSRHETLTLLEATNGTRESFYRVKSEVPFTFIVDGPGVAVVHAHRLTKTGEAAATQSLNILENDVMLMTVELDAPLSATRTVEGSPQYQVSDLKEYKLTVGSKVSRFSVVPTETPYGVLIAYTFLAKEKATSGAMALDFGADLGLGGQDAASQTMLTEVAVRDRVVEKVVEVPGSSEVVGVGLGGGTLVPSWGGQPGPAVGVEVRANFGRYFALSFEALGSQHDMAAGAADPLGASRDANARVLAAALLGKAVVRLPLGPYVALYVAAGGGTVFAYATGGASGSLSASRWIPAVAGNGGLEVRLGPGWLGLDGGFIYAGVRDFTGIVDGYATGGIPAGLRYRLGF